MLAFALGSTAGAIGADLALRTLPIISSKAIDGIVYFTTSGIQYHPGFIDWIVTLNKTDIERRIVKLHQLSEDLSVKEKNGHVFEPCVKMCIQDINHVLEDLNKLLDKVKQMKEYQDTIYFGTWRLRLPDCSPEIEQLKHLSDLLKARFDELRTTIGIMKGLS